MLVGTAAQTLLGTLLLGQSNACKKRPTGFCVKPGGSLYLTVKIGPIGFQSLYVFTTSPELQY